MTRMKDTTRAKLLSVSVATLTTALFKRGFRNQFIQDVHPLNPDAGNMVGEAFTLRYMPAREDLNPITVFKDRAHPQRKAVEECPPGAVLVIDSRKDARAASAGGILITRLMVRGCAGVVWSSPLTSISMHRPKTKADSGCSSRFSAPISSAPGASLSSASRNTT